MFAFFLFSNNLFIDRKPCRQVESLQCTLTRRGYLVLTVVQAGRHFELVLAFCFMWTVSFSQFMKTYRSCNFENKMCVLSISFSWKVENSEQIVIMQNVEEEKSLTIWYSIKWLCKESQYMLLCLVL